MRICCLSNWFIFPSSNISFCDDDNTYSVSHDKNIMGKIILIFSVPDKYIF
jgi:hypothetical protein